MYNSFLFCKIYGDMGHSLGPLQYSANDVKALSKQYGSVLC